MNKSVHITEFVTDLVRPQSKDLMPITPDFSIRQDHDFLYFTIKCPNVRAKDMDLVVADTDFHFSAEPYLLILHFQHSLRDGEGCTAAYDIDSGIFTATIRKRNPGEDFPEILLFTSLKHPVNDRNETKPLIEVVGRTCALEYIDDPPNINNYGFNFWAHDFFENLEEIIPYVTDIPNPDTTPLPYRSQERMEKEDEDYDPDRVINDFLNPFPIEKDELSLFYKEFTDAEKKKLLEIKRLEFLMNRDVAKSSFYSIAEVVYSSVMDVICFGAEGSCESHWTIAKLSPTLSWFDSFSDPKDMIIATVRRTMEYCVTRSFSVAELGWKETAKLLRSGRTGVLKALIRAKNAMEKAEHRWRLNRLYIDPMISWIQELKEDEYKQYVEDVCKNVDSFITKDEVSHDWCIDLLEKYAVKMKESGEIKTLSEVRDIEENQKYGDDNSEDELPEHNYEPVNIYE